MTTTASAQAASFPAGTIITTAGNGQAGFVADGGPAIGTKLHYPYGTAIDRAGNIYIADSHNHRVRKITPDGNITTVAGTGTAGFVSDGGPAVATRLHYPTGVAVDAAGNLYIADRHNHRIRKVTTNGIITTVAGNGNAGFISDGGPAVATPLNYPWSVAVDEEGNLYIGDTNNHRVRKVATNGNIITVAGNGNAGFVSDGGPAVATPLYHPFEVTVDAAGALYIADRYNHRVRKVSTNGIITTVAGTGTAGYVADGGPAVATHLHYPAGVAVDKEGNLYIADTNNHRVRKVSAGGIITTVAGTGTAGYVADGGPAAGTRVYYPHGVAVDGSGSLYIGDGYNHRVRRVYGVTAVVPPTPPMADLYGEIVAPASVPRGQEFDLGARIRSRGPATVDGMLITVVLNLPYGLVDASGGTDRRLSRTFAGSQLVPFSASLDGVFRVKAPESTKPGTYEATLEIQYGGDLNLKDNTFTLPVTITVPAPVADETALTVFQEVVPESAPGQTSRCNLRFLAPTGQPVNPGVIIQRYTAPTGFVFTGQPVFAYHGTIDGVVSGPLDHEVYDSGRTLIIRANPHLNTTAGDTGSLVYTIPMRAQQDATAGLKSDGSASIGKRTPVQLVGKVIAATTGLSARITQSRPENARVRPGQQWVYPAVFTITNTGQSTIGAQRLVLTAPEGMRFTQDQLAMSREGEMQEIVSVGERSNGNRTLTCQDVRFDLARGKWAVVYPEMEVDEGAEPGTVRVGIELGAPAFASALATITIEPR
ncbi:hypothetical protein ACFPM3_18300 [Streptomyces coeruleoprunus]|uniref:NHL repeat-containing protein n=1 Tax=Streptomyces coeruleoprunus TaxID=285563 RepID=A0ABV9XIG4_9ACTN